MFLSPFPAPFPVPFSAQETEPASSLLMLDTFTDSAGTLLADRTPDVGSNPWIAVDGVHAINADNKVFSSEYDGVVARTVVDCGEADVVVSADITKVEACGLSIIYRFVDSSNMFFCYWFSGLGKIYEKTGGVSVQRFVASCTGTDTMALQMSVKGNVHTISYNDVEKGSYTTSVRNSATVCGIMDDSNLGATTFDNFQVLRND